MELEEVSLLVNVEGSTEELGTASKDFSGRPFLSDTCSFLSELLGPLRVAEFQKETRRLGLINFTLVKGLVHPDFLEISRDVLNLALADVCAALALSTSDDLIRAIGELGSHVTPDRPVFNRSLIAGFDSLDLAVAL